MKPWWQSKTLWFNLISAVVGILEVLSNDPRTSQKFPWLVIAIGVGNVLLRFSTTKPIKVPKAKPDDN